MGELVEYLSMNANHIFTGIAYMLGGAGVMLVVIESNYSNRMDRVYHQAYNHGFMDGWDERAAANSLIEGESSLTMD